MIRNSKLLTAGLILAGGVGTAFLFRHPLESSTLAATATEQPAPTSPAGTATAGWEGPSFAPVTLPSADTPVRLASEPRLEPVEPPLAVARANEPLAVPEVPVFSQDASPQTDPWSARRQVFEAQVMRPKIHVVRDGDTLELLAQSYLGNPDRAYEIYEENRHLLPGPNLLPIGAELTIPITPGDVATPTPGASVSRPDADGLVPIERPRSGGPQRLH
jgi:nucleoid-associated protein YgaU